MDLVEKIKVYDVHVGLEPARIVFLDLPDLIGENVLQQFQNAKDRFDALRKKIAWEPRGHRDMFGAFLLPSTKMHPECAYSVIFFDANGFLNMCGHASLGIAYFLVRNQLAPRGDIALETFAGKVVLEVDDEVRLRGVPSFVYASNQRVPVGIHSVKEVTCDISFGGNFYAFVNVDQIHLTVSENNLSVLIALAKAILLAANQSIQVIHPCNPNLKSIGLVSFYQLSQDYRSFKHCVIWGQGQFDRSPCGTGTSAMMALLAEQGRLRLDEKIISQSIIGSTFTGYLESVDSVKGFNFYIPWIIGRPYLSAVSEFIYELDDPLRAGFIVRP